MIYNFNLGIGWASSGVEFAQLYRARIFRRLGQPARFIFTDMFPRDNIEHLTANIGYLDEEIIWLYTYFTDFHTAPVTYTLSDFLSTLSEVDYSLSRTGKIGRIYYPHDDKFITLYFSDEKSENLHRVELVSGGKLIRKDYFTYGKVYSEYYAPLDGKAHLYLRRFFNTDGTAAYDEIIDDDEVMFRFPDRILYSKEELVGYFVQSLHLSEEDTVIIDRTTGIGQAILENAGRAAVGIAVHADHYSASNITENHILWNNYYEYSFDMIRHLSFFLVSTDAQKHKMEEQFEKYIGEVPAVYTVPVGSLEKLVRSDKRRPFSVITASRLASEKHIDWIIEAVCAARQEVPEITLDVCGEGREMKSLRKLIAERDASSFIRLLGQQDMSELYRDYELYLSGSTSEGFGLSLMEAVGSGLPIIGFDVPYGNPTFIDDGKNGYLVPVDDKMPIQQKIDGLRDALIRFFLESDRTAFSEASYKKAEAFLTEKVMEQWKKVIDRK